MPCCLQNGRPDMVSVHVDEPPPQSYITDRNGWDCFFLCKQKQVNKNITEYTVCMVLCTLSTPFKAEDGNSSYTMVRDSATWAEVASCQCLKQQDISFQESRVGGTMEWICAVPGPPTATPPLHTRLSPASPLYSTTLPL